MQLSVGAFVDASNSGGWVAVTEGDEHPDQFGARVAGELQDEREGPLRCGCVDEGEVQLRAARELCRVWTPRLAGQ